MKVLDAELERGHMRRRAHRFAHGHDRALRAERETRRHQAQDGGRVVAQAGERLAAVREREQHAVGAGAHRCGNGDRMRSAHA